MKVITVMKPVKIYQCEYCDYQTHDEELVNIHEECCKQNHCSHKKLVDDNEYIGFNAPLAIVKRCVECNKIVRR